MSERRRATPARRWWGLVGLLLTSCVSPVVEVQPCPNLSYAKDVLYRLGGELTLGSDVTDSLSSEPTAPRFVAHPVSVPLAGEIDLTFTLSGTGMPATATLYVYGPRGSDGIFGTCAEQVVATTVTVTVPADGGGEWLVLVGTDPVSSTAWTYQLSATCAGDQCDGASCPVLSTTCAEEVCADGFDTVTADGVTCPVCSCNKTECGPFQTRVFDACVCDCQVPLNPATVCGTDGKTYATACFAGCAQVGVANADGGCETVCPDASQCTRSCPNGYQVEGGCPICACANSCDAVDATWRPVCGTDGLTYGSKERLECETDGVSVAYVGQCLPYCAMPPDCALTCEFGLVPAPVAGQGCFKCECLSAPPEDKPLICAIAGGARSTQGPNQLASVRTFTNGKAAKGAGFQPNYAESCPSSICGETPDCAGADATLLADLAEIPGAPAAAKLICDRIGQSPTKACRTDIELTADTCDCLKRVSGRVYDPVCGSVSGKDRTFFNLCTATCLGAFPIRYPGECCEKRLTIDERWALLEAVAPICKAIGRVPRIFAATACPPSLETCKTTTDVELCCKAPPTGGRQPGQPGAPPP